MPEWLLAFIMGMGLLFLFSAIGVPIAFSLMAAGFIGLYLFQGSNMAFSALGPSIFGTLFAPSLLPVPMFVLIGTLLARTGLSEVAYSALARLFAGFKAGLPLATNALLTMMGALMGASAAAISIVTQMAAPELKARGFSSTFIAGVITGGGCLAVIIPPSFLMILYAYVMQRPIIPLFAGGIIPGLLMSLGYSLWILLYTWRRPPATGKVTLEESVSLRTRLRALIELMPLLAVAAGMLGAMFLGYASVTEGAAVGVFGILAVGLAYRRLSLRTAWGALWDSVFVTGFIMLLVIAGRYFGAYFHMTGVSSEFTTWIIGLRLGGLPLLWAIMGIFLLLGCVMDTISMTLVAVPIAAGALEALGMDPFWLGVLFVINLEMALLTPPVGVNLFVMAGVGRPYGITFENVLKGMLPFLVVDGIVLMLVSVMPILVTFMSSRVY